MNQKTVKKLKKTINYEQEDDTSRRLFKRLKKQYSRLSEKAKPIFLDKLQDMYNN